MKANELSRKDLMVGDWVNTPKGNYQIDSIQDNDVVGTTYNNGEGVESLFRIKKLSQIPLTPEILEKNRFKKCAGNEWSVFKYEDDDYTKKALYQVLWSADELYLEIASYTSITGEFNRMGVEFVHQLQHALRLCGIEKEIIL